MKIKVYTWREKVIDFLNKKQNCLTVWNTCCGYHVWELIVDTDEYELSLSMDSQAIVITRK